MIEFVKGDEWCSWNGIVMTPEIQAKIFGIEEEPIMEKEFIIAGDSVYTDKDLGIVLKVFGHEEENYPYHVLISKDLFNGIKHIKPYHQFWKDYPNFNQELLDKFNEELDEYYETLHNPSRREEV